MKTTKLVFALAVGLFSFTTIIAQEHDHSKMDHSKMKMDKKEVYTCSMHPEIQENKPGDCPKCGMKLVKKEEALAKAYSCTMKCEGEKNYAKPGDCPKCGMKLVEKNAANKKEESHKKHNHSH